MGKPNAKTSIPDPNQTSAHETQETKLDSRSDLFAQSQPKWRYLLGEKLGEGGMGVVFRATDTVFQREVAVKVLHERFEPDSISATRFAEEAQITGQLQHPAIPPVHDLGTLPDGRAFLAMKLIRGQTFDVLLGQRSAPTNERGRFLVIFEQICQGVGYAHAHGVIHRDLKPANVMVGKFGEVQVMDWGLAKLLANTETEIRNVREADAQGTQYGAVLGTLSFMPPEQARGEIDQVDAQSDVFGLGGILAEILTGHAPFVGTSTHALRNQSATGDLRDCFARLDACGADAELVALCKSCLAASKQGRPKDAAEVAQRIATFRVAAEERARLAEMERAKTQLQAEEQRKRWRLQLRLIAVVGVLLLVGGLLGWSVWDRRTRTVEAVQALLLQSEDSLRQGKASAATQTLEAARKRAAEGGAEQLMGRLEKLERERDLLGALEGVDTERWTVGDKNLPETKDMVPRFLKVLQQFKVDPEDGVEAVVEAVNASTQRERLLGVFDWLLAQNRSDKIREVLRRADTDPFRSQLRDAVLAQDGKKIQELVRQPQAAQQPPWFLVPLAQNKWLNLQQQRELLQMAISHSGCELPLVMALVMRYAFDNPQEAKEHLMWCQVAAAVAPDNFAAQFLLGNALLDRADLQRSEAARRQAIRINPTHPFGHNNLGNLLRIKGDLANAEASFREAVRLDPNFANAFINLGAVLRSKGDLVGAESAFREAIRLNPKSAGAQVNLALVLAARGETAKAEALYLQAIRVEPKNAQIHYNLGGFLAGKGDLTRAESALRQAIALDKNYTLARTALGNVLNAQGDFAEAQKCFAEVLRSDPQNKLAAAGVAQGKEAQRKMARIPEILTGKNKAKSAEELSELAALCSLPRQQRFATAVTLYTKAFEADEKLAQNLSANHRYNAARAAVRAGNTEGVDAPKETARRVALREQALGWLRADLASLQKQANSKDAKQRQQILDTLNHWLRDSDFVTVREAKFLVKLAGKQEQSQWSAFWQSVRVTLAQLQNSSDADVLPLPSKE